ncbi:MAG: PLP-dependent transferase [Olsenella sp.]|jgi:hypothetical protein|nr:PLP-dependent transferase [Olsenella sp.]
MAKRGSVLRVVSKDELEGALAKGFSAPIEPLVGVPVACADVRGLAAASHEQGVAVACDLSLVGAACAAVRLGADVAFAPAADEGEMLVWVARGERGIADAARGLLSAGREAGDPELALLEQRARMWRASSDAAQVVASYLVCHPRVERVAYPGLRSDPSYEIASRTLENGFGPLVDVRLVGEGTWRRITCTPDDPLAQVALLEERLRERLS